MSFNLTPNLPTIRKVSKIVMKTFQQCLKNVTTCTHEQTSYEGHIWPGKLQSVISLLLSMIKGSKTLNK